MAKLEQLATEIDSTLESLKADKLDIPNLCRLVIGFLSPPTLFIASTGISRGAGIAVGSRNRGSSFWITSSMLFGKNERSVLVFPWPSLKTLAQPITMKNTSTLLLTLNTLKTLQPSNTKSQSASTKCHVFHQKMQAVSLIQRSALLEQLSQVFRTNFLQSFDKVLELQLFYRGKVWNYNFFKPSF